MIPDQAVFAALAISLIGQLSYVRDTLLGRTKPNRVSWALWALIAWVAFVAQVAEGVGVQSLHTFMVGFGPAMIVAASFFNKKAYWRITSFDIICGILSLIGIGLWLLTREGALAVLFAIIADTLAGLPTLRKAWSYPESESWFIFLLAIVSAIIVLLTFDHITFVGMAFSIYILTFCAVLVGLIRFRLGVRFRQWRTNST